MPGASWGSSERDSTETLFMDLDTFPNIIDYWGPNGMVFVRNPQVRYTPIDRDGMKVAFSLESPNAAIDTGKVSDVDPALAAGVTGRNRYPDFVANLRLDRDWGHFQAAGMLRQVGFETPTNPRFHTLRHCNRIRSQSERRLNTSGKDRIVGQLVYGRGIASYMNDGGVDLAPDAALQAEAVTVARLVRVLRPLLERQVEQLRRLTASIASPTPTVSPATRSRKAVMRRPTCSSTRSRT